MVRCNIVLNKKERGLHGLETRTNADFFLSVRVRSFIPRRPRPMFSVSFPLSYTLILISNSR